jgi:hypothetical protein
MKKCFYVIIGLIFVFCLTGCSSKKAISSDKFMSIAKNYKLEVTDVSNHFKNVNEIKSAAIAESDDLWKMEFYVFNDKDAAIDMYNNNKKFYNNNIESSKSAKENSSRNTNDFTLVSDEFYMYVSRVKNTLVYVYAPIDSRTDVDKLIRALKY